MLPVSQNVLTNNKSAQLSALFASSWAFLQSKTERKKLFQWLLSVFSYVELTER